MRFQSHNKIIFAHPDHKIVSLYAPHLSQHFQVDSAHDGLTALRKIRVNRPNLILSDIRLPILSGLSLLKYVRNNFYLSATPFIFFTAHHNVSAALGLGANDWIVQDQAEPDLIIEKIYYHLSRTSFPQYADRNYYH